MRFHRKSSFCVVGQKDNTVPYARRFEMIRLIRLILCETVRRQGEVEILWDCAVGSTIILLL
jgi:hypothetical protein